MSGLVLSLRGFIQSGDLVLIKGSRGVGLDKIVAMLTGATEAVH